MADAPSTALLRSAVPLPRFAGQDERHSEPANPGRARYISPMQWTDEGIVLGVKRYGESSVILELMTQERGRHLGLVRGGTGRRLRGVLQPGNSLRATWRARLDDHLGNYAVEGINLRAADFSPRRMPSTASPISRRCAGSWPSASRMRGVHGALEAILDPLDDPVVAAPMVARFELSFLAELGFGLDLSSCAATGRVTIYLRLAAIGPRGVALRRRSLPDKLMRLPGFLARRPSRRPPPISPTPLP